MSNTGQHAKIGYRFKDDPSHTSTAYVVYTSEDTAEGENKYTDEPVVVHWNGTEWLEQ